MQPPHLRTSRLQHIMFLFLDVVILYLNVIFKCLYGMALPNLLPGILKTDAILKQSFVPCFSKCSNLHWPWTCPSPLTKKKSEWHWDLAMALISPVTIKMQLSVHVVLTWWGWPLCGPVLVTLQHAHFLGTTFITRETYGGLGWRYHWHHIHSKSITLYQHK